MIYTIKASSVARTSAQVELKPSAKQFGITPNQQEGFSSPADLFLGAFASCILKNIERFSDHDEIRV
jgi:organic hydroperoxide reductase OsmC/OhrA